MYVHGRILITVYNKCSSDINRIKIVQIQREHVQINNYVSFKDYKQMGPKVIKKPNEDLGMVSPF